MIIILSNTHLLYICVEFQNQIPKFKTCTCGSSCINPDRRSSQLSDSPFCYNVEEVLDLLMSSSWGGGADETAAWYDEAASWVSAGIAPPTNISFN